VKPYQTADQLVKKPLQILRLKDVFAQASPPGVRWTRMRLPPIGQKMVRTLPNKLPVVVEHRTDDSWHLVIPNFGIWKLLAQPMPVPKRRMLRKGGTHQLPPGMPAPVRFLILDATGHRVRSLYMTGDERVGSVHELGAAAYATDNMTPTQRTIRHQEKIRRDFPLQADDMLHEPKIRKIIRRKPPGMLNTKWVEKVVRAKHGVVHKGDRPGLQSEVTAAITEFLWTRTARAHKMPPTYHANLGHLNRARRREKAKRIREAEPVPVANMAFYRTI
jgi:hypothetical protein